MKKYIVLQQIGKMDPDFKEQFDELEDAKMYTQAMRKAHPDREYCVYIRH